jgi:tyrosyl-tRNA synthetase
MASNPILEGVSITVPDNGLEEKLAWSKKTGKPLNVKLGFDPTAPDLHLGHAVVLRKLKDFQDQGHQIHVIIGDFTARIGDPTGRNASRPPLTKEAVAENAKTYLNQLGKVLDVDKLKVHFNSTWFEKMGFAEVIKLLSETTLAQLMQRKDFADRFAANTPIAMHELVYPIMQGYDSLMVNADVEIGGTDQLFNCMVGKHLQSSRGLPSQTVISMPLLVGLDGKDKMSKSKGNCIALTEDPAQMFGKAMSVPDALLPDYIRLASTYSPDLKAQELEACRIGNPMDVKLRLASHLVQTYHSPTAAAQAREAFRRNVQSRSLEDKDFSKIALQSLAVLSEAKETSLATLCSALSGESKGNARRLIEAGGVSVNGQKITDVKTTLAVKDLPGLKLKIGKRGLYQLTDDPTQFRPGVDI